VSPPSSESSQDHGEHNISFHEPFLERSAIDIESDSSILIILVVASAFITVTSCNDVL
jgi:hypothetical protein